MSVCKMQTKIHNCSFCLVMAGWLYQCLVTAICERAFGPHPARADVRTGQVPHLLGLPRHLSEQVRNLFLFCLGIRHCSTKLRRTSLGGTKTALTGSRCFIEDKHLMHPFKPYLETRGRDQRDYAPRLIASETGVMGIF